MNAPIAQPCHSKFCNYTPAVAKGGLCPCDPSLDPPNGGRGAHRYWSVCSAMTTRPAAQLLDLFPVSLTLYLLLQKWLADKVCAGISTKLCKQQTSGLCKECYYEAQLTQFLLPSSAKTVKVMAGIRGKLSYCCLFRWMLERDWESAPATGAFIAAIAC